LPADIRDLGKVGDRDRRRTPFGHQRDCSPGEGRP
jgi:hypothetical protein